MQNTQVSQLGQLLQVRVQSGRIELDRDPFFSLQTPAQRYFWTLELSGIYSLRIEEMT
jgi:hypothetical protein